MRWNAAQVSQDQDHGESVREAAHGYGDEPLVIAKIEQARALERVDDILAAADSLMIARGDLGVEVPIEQIGVLQRIRPSRSDRFASAG